MSNAGRLRELLKTQETLAIPGCYDCFSAKIIENMGFPYVYLTGFGTEASKLGCPDMGLTTLTEMLEHARNVANSVKIPLISDVDTGFGGVFHVMRTVQTFEQAGVAGIHLEDQVVPRRCSSMAGAKTVSVDQMRAKLRAAIEARHDPDFVLIGRSDSKASLGFDEVKRRLRIYLDEGADLVMIGEKYTLKEIEDLAGEFRGKFMMSGGVIGRESANLSVSHFASIGVKVVIYPLVGLGAAGKAIQEAYRPLAERGRITEEELKASTLDMDTLNTILESRKYYDIDERFPYY